MTEQSVQVTGVTAVTPSGVARASNQQLSPRTILPSIRSCTACTVCSELGPASRLELTCDQAVCIKLGDAIRAISQNDMVVVIAGLFTNGP